MATAAVPKRHGGGDAPSRTPDVGGGASAQPHLRTEEGGGRLPAATGPPVAAGSPPRQ
jgi:hypothetical protein